MNIAQTSIAILLIATALGGCAANQPFRTNYAPSTPDDPTAIIEVGPDYKMGYVEFDDQGWFWDTGQRAAVEQMIQGEAGIGSAPAGAPQGIILVVFVHGWKDNAAFDGGGVIAFRKILHQLSAGEKALKGKGAARKVVGVYVGWRGMSATWEPFKELSFWERKETAHKVGGYGAMTALLIDLENIQKASLEARPSAERQTELIIIGHSFGGAAVYSALSQIITERFTDTIEKGKTLKPVGDQIILLNPAFEALRHYDLNQMAAAIYRFPVDQRPVLTIFTSRADWATHYMFPLGRFFATLFEANRNDKQKLAGLETVGWFKPFITHHLDYNASATFSPAQTSTINPATHRHEFHDRGALQKSVENTENQRARWNPARSAPQPYYFDDSILNPVGTFRPGDPFLVVSVDPQIMKDHDDIDNTVLINFIREYIQFCNPGAIAASK